MWYFWFVYCFAIAFGIVAAASILELIGRVIWYCIRDVRNAIRAQIGTS